MPTTCVSTYRCNTHAPGWLYGAHPSPLEGIVQRYVCFHWVNHCCRFYMSISVRNCGLFYVYILRKLSNCYLRYCVTKWECIIGETQQRASTLRSTVSIVAFQGLRANLFFFCKITLILSKTCVWVLSQNHNAIEEKREENRIYASAQSKPHKRDTITMQRFLIFQCKFDRKAFA